MAGNTRQLTNSSAHELRSFRNLIAAKFFNRLDITEVAIRCREVVGSISEWDILIIVACLTQLLGTAMELPDDRLTVDNSFAVEIENEAQHAMRRRMLRPHV